MFTGMVSRNGLKQQRTTLDSFPFSQEQDPEIKVTKTGQLKTEKRPSNVSTIFSSPVFIPIAASESCSWVTGVEPSTAIVPVVAHLPQGCVTCSAFCCYVTGLNKQVYTPP